MTYNCKITILEEIWTPYCGRFCFNYIVKDKIHTQNKQRGKVGLLKRLVLIQYIVNSQSSLITFGAISIHCEKA